MTPAVLRPADHSSGAVMPTDRHRDDAGATAGVDRRGFLGVALGGAALPLAAGSAGAQEKPMPDPRAAIPVTLAINGRTERLSLDPRTSLLDAVREEVGLTGSKKGCDHGQCGACTMLVEGRRVLSCLTLAAMVDGQAITTVEGLAGTDGGLHPMQQAFIDQDAFQCGYCTPGQIVSAVACVQEGHARTDAEIREYMSGNLCRCAAYPNIVAAVKQAKAVMGA
jgi:xanthine dehydrogenase YagT iron-sulfur-binding subunit